MMNYLEITLSQLNQKYKIWSADAFRNNIHQKITEIEWVEKFPAVLPPEVFKFRKTYFKSLQRFEYEKTLNEMSKKGVKMIYPGHPDFPAQFFNLQHAPLALSYCGSPVWKSQLSLGVVGARDPSKESRVWMEEEFSKFINEEKPIIISGAARGIDQLGHSLALREGVPTIALIPSGLGRIYPATFTEWIPAILETGGALISEYVYEAPMFKGNFLERNRLISALSQVLFLVEAGRKSGTLVTANYAVEQNIPLAILPGHPKNPKFSGSLDLLTDGAAMIRDAMDLKVFFRAELGLDLVGKS